MFSEDEEFDKDELRRREEEMWANCQKADRLLICIFLFVIALVTLLIFMFS
jgi:hypothetical protein